MPGEGGGERKGDSREAQKGSKRDGWKRFIEAWESGAEQINYSEHMRKDEKNR